MTGKSRKKQSRGSTGVKSSKRNKKTDVLEEWVKNKDTKTKKKQFKKAICQKKTHANDKYLEYLSELYNWEICLAEQTGMPIRKIGYSVANNSWNPGSEGTLIPPENRHSEFSENPKNFINYQNNLLLQQIDEGDVLINITRYSPKVLVSNLSNILNEKGAGGDPDLNPADVVTEPLNNYVFFGQNNINTFALNLTKKTQGFFPSHCLDENAIVIQLGLDTEWWNEEFNEELYGTLHFSNNSVKSTVNLENINEGTSI